MLKSIQRRAGNIIVGNIPVRRYSDNSNREPLRVLFCGSDAFSIASLKALCNEHRKSPELVESIDVVCKSPKRTGRGLKTLREVPIASAATELSLPLHQIDTFTGWHPPEPRGLPINLVVAVSFGLKVPPRILSAARYGGLNVHPSMLPDFRGSAPLHHTLLTDSKMTGVSLQTLHPTKFDRGTVLAQTPYPGIKYDATTVPELGALLAPMAADMLVRGIREGVYIPPFPDSASHGEIDNTIALRLAPKITSNDRHVQWHSWTAQEIMRRSNIVGPMWNYVTCKITGRQEQRRIIWVSGFRLSTENIGQVTTKGRPIMTGFQEKSQSIHITTCDGQVLTADEVKLEGQGVTEFSHAAKHAGMVGLPIAQDYISQKYAVFHKELC